MKFGAVYCQSGIGYKYDRAAIRDFIQSVEGLGYDYLLTYDLLTKTADSSPPVNDSEPFALLSYAAALTTKLELATGILVLPSRQTLLVAKQAAELDLLSGGRVRLGVSVGWNEPEYQAMGVDFNSRGERIEEQVTVLRELWTKPEVTFKGKYHHLEKIGIHPLPVQQPIPIWFGGYANATFRRIAQMGDGWLAYNTPSKTAKTKVALLHDYLKKAGRKPEDVGIGICIEVPDADKYFDTTGYIKHIQDWRKLGATHCDIEIFLNAEKPIQAHIKALKRFKDEVMTAI